MRRVNLRFAAFSLATLVALSGAVYAFHGVQVKRNAGALLTQADRAEEQGRPDRAARYLARYVALAPSDADALARYGLLLDRLARTDKARADAFLVLERAVAKSPDRPEVRRRLAGLAIQIGRYSDAADHLRPLLAASPNDADLLSLLGQAEDGAGRNAQARAAFERAVQHAPQNLEHHLRLAGLLRRKLNQPALADACVEKMIAANTRSPKAYLLRGIYYREFDQPDRSAQSIARAYALAPADADVLLAMARIKRPNQHDSRTFLERGVQLHPKDSRFYLALARTDLRSGRHDEVARRLRACLAKVPHDTDLLWNVTDVLLDAGDRKEARSLLARLRRNSPAARLDFLEGRLALADGAWLAASACFNRALQQQTADVPGLSKRAGLFLGQCYEQLGNPDLALAAYRRASAADPLWVPARAGVASASLTLGKIDSALEEYRAIQANVPESRFVVVRLLIHRNLGLSAANRDWAEVEQELAAAEKALPDSAQGPILRAEVLAGQNKLKEAQTLLEAVPARMRKQASYWVARAGLAERMRQTHKVLPILDEADRLLGPNVDLQLARARHWATQPRQQATAALARLERGAGTWSAAEQARFHHGLAEAHYRLGNTRDAERLWTSVAQTEGLENSLHVRFLLFDLALRAGDDSAMRRVISQIRTIEGAGGTLWRYGEAARLVRQAQDGRKDQPTLDRARALLAEVAGRRPAWSRVPLLEATLAELEGDTEGAIKGYQAAIDRGERELTIVRRAVQLLYERQRYVEADQIIRKLPVQAPISGDLVKLAAEISLRKQDAQRALELAQHAVPTESRDYRDRMWIGQILWAVQRNEEAEQHLRQAVALAPEVPDPWVALVQFLARTGQQKKAEAALSDAQTKVPVGVRALALAQGYEALGQRDKAEKLYQSDLATRPDDATVLRGAAEFHLRAGRPDRAEPPLARLVGARAKLSAQERAWARRNLAFCLAARATREDLDRALALLAENRRGKQEAVEDLRTRAVVLSLQPGRQAEAIRLLEDLGRRQPLTPDEQFVLAGLHEAEGDWPAARARLRSLVTAHGDRPLYLRHYISGLLQRGDSGEAAFWLAKLKKTEPDSPLTVELEVRVLQKQGKAAEALALVKQRASKKDFPAAVAARLLDLLGEPAARDAEVAYRSLAAGSPRPEDRLGLANFLARRGRPGEALDECEGVWRAGHPEAAAHGAVGVLRAARGSAAHARRVQGWLSQALKERPSAPLLLALADLRDFEGSYAEAVAIYRRALQQDRSNALARNNLAWLLALHLNRPDEALAMINSAIETTGPTPSLLDTRAVILVRLGKAKAALKDLDRVVAQAPGASAHFHRACACLQTRDRVTAGEALRSARAAGLRPADLHPLEHQTYRQVLASLGQK
jgi:tetratricopeptide (TPR) repeat protein